MACGNVCGGDLGLYFGPSSGETQSTRASKTWPKDSPNETRSKDFSKVEAGALVDGLEDIEAADGRPGFSGAEAAKAKTLLKKNGIYGPNKSITTGALYRFLVRLRHAVKDVPVDRPRFTLEHLSTDGLEYSMRLYFNFNKEMELYKVDYIRGAQLSCDMWMFLLSIDRGLPLPPKQVPVPLGPVFKRHPLK